MYSLSNRRGHHRKRLSALRLSSDSTVTTLPLYTSPARQRHPDLPEIPSEQPPAYSDSAEEADEDTDASEPESSVAYIPSPPPSLPVSPRRARRSQVSSRSSYRRQQQSVASSSDPYLDSLLERSVHALEMSNALLQSTMSTQSSLSAVLADDAVVDRHLEARARRLTSRIRSNRDQQRSWMDDLDEITRGVEGLFDGGSSDEEGSQVVRSEAPVSQSLPSTSGFAEHMRSRQDQRTSTDVRRQHHRASRSTTNLQLSAHDRNDFVAPAPRALTMYIDSSEAANLITLPSTLGVRPSLRAPPAPLSQQSAFSASATPEPTPASAPAQAERPSSRAVEMLASYVMPRRSTSTSSSPPTSRTRRGSSSSSVATAKRPRVSPPPLTIDAPSGSSSTALSSRSMTPVNGSPALRQHRPLTPPIEELSTSSTSSESATLHVDRTVSSLRQILDKQRSASKSPGKPSSSSTHSAPPVSRPSLLSPPSVAPVSGTSTATASVSRLFTKARHSTSRAQSPPRQSSLKKGSAPSTPVTSTPVPVAPSPSPSMLSVPDLLGLGRSKSASSSGASTPKRISFIEPSESYSSSKPEGPSSRFLATKTRSKPKSGKHRGRDQKAKGKGKAKDDESDGEKVGWWTSWLLGAAGTETGSGLSMGVGRTRSEERYAYAGRGGGSSAVGSWSMRPGYGGSLEEWGA